MEGNVYTLGGREFRVKPATLGDHREILNIQKAATERIAKEGAFSDAHITSAVEIMLVLLRGANPEIKADDLYPLLPGKDSLWQAEVRRLYQLADLVDDSPGESKSP